MSLDAEVAVASEGTPVRHNIEASVAQHSPGPDVENIVSGAREEHDRHIKNRNNDRMLADRSGRLWEGEARDKRRADIRNAVNEVRIKTSQNNVAPEPIKAGEVPIGAPPTWDSSAKAAWDSLPPAARLAVQRDHAAIKPHLEKYQELDKVLAPVRDEMRRQGVKSDAEGVGALLKWEAAVRNPQTRVQAIGNLMRQFGVTPDMLGGSPQQHQQPHYSPEHVATAERQVNQFSQGRPHFAAVRETMGLLLERHHSRYLQPDGSVNLNRVYIDACKADGLTATQPSRPRSSPSSRPPAGAFPGSTARTPVRQHILDAVRSR